MLMRTDPFRELDRLAAQLMSPAAGTWSRPSAMPMDAYRAGDELVVMFDLPGVAPDAIEVDVELLVGERPFGTFSRQLFLGETLDTDRIDASYADGVLTLRLPIAERAKPRREPITRVEGSTPIDASSAERVHAEV